jgi:hypothetical protein
MKKLLIIILLACGSLQAQELSKSVLFVQQVLVPEGLEINCASQTVYHKISKKEIIIRAQTVSFNIQVLQRNLAGSSAWFGVDGTDYYIITPIQVGGDDFALVFQPVDKSHNRVAGLPTTVISTVAPCGGEN